MLRSIAFTVKTIEEPLKIDVYLCVIIIDTSHITAVKLFSAKKKKNIFYENPSQFSLLVKECRATGHWPPAPLRSIFQKYKELNDGEPSQKSLSEPRPY